MFKIVFISIGDLPRGSFFEIGDGFRRRLQEFSRFEHRVVKHEDDIDGAVPDGSFVVVLDAAGKTFTSELFAKRVERLVDDGIPLTVVLGGPFGLSTTTKQRADLLLSLSPMTTTHDLAHLFALEQLYRAFTIIKGKTYHY